MEPGPYEVPRPAPPRSRREALREWVTGTLRWFGPARLAGSVVAAVMVGVGGWWLVHAPPARVESSLPTAPRTGPSTPATAKGGTTPATGAPNEVVVHVAGAVARPGLVRLRPTDRVADAVAAAGGPVAGADLDALNLAALVVDGSRIYVPREDETVPFEPGGNASPVGKLDVNRASAAELETLPGIGPATAAAIVTHRTSAGPFRTVDDLLDVPGIGPAKLAQFRDLVTV